MICQTVRRVLTMRQKDNEPSGEYYKRFISCVDVAESQWGTLVPMAAATNETNEKTSRDKFITSFSCRSGYKKVWKVLKGMVFSLRRYPIKIQQSYFTIPSILSAMSCLISLDVTRLCQTCLSLLYLFTIKSELLLTLLVLLLILL
jgi:hypothetical protein